MPNTCTAVNQTQLASKMMKAIQFYLFQEHNGIWISSNLQRAFTASTRANKICGNFDSMLCLSGIQDFIPCYLKHLKLLTVSLKM